MSKLNKEEQQLVAEVLRAKRKAQKAQKELADAVAQAFELVKQHGKLELRGDAVQYIPQGETKLVLNSEKLQLEHPVLYARYSELKDGAKEHIRITLHK